MSKQKLLLIIGLVLIIFGIALTWVFGAWANYIILFGALIMILPALAPRKKGAQSKVTPGEKQKQ